MPICQTCYGFYVKVQSFNTIFKQDTTCNICETYQQKPVSYEVFPLENTTVECYVYDAQDHPALTKRFFETITKNANIEYCFYEHVWQNSPLSLVLLTTLFQPFRVMSYSRLERGVFELIDTLKEKLAQ